MVFWFLRFLLLVVLFVCFLFNFDSSRQISNIPQSNVVNNVQVITYLFCIPVPSPVKVIKKGLFLVWEHYLTFTIKTL